ncbi:MAG: hypothetical protein QM759_03805 [Terricaulis sp.]
MIHGGWSYVEAAYAVTLAGLIGLAVVVVVRFVHWSREARKLDKPDAKP